MRFKRLLILSGGALIVAAFLTVFLAPFVVATGLRLWVARIAGQEKLQIELGKIEAPFLRPVVVHDLHITSDSAAPFRIDASTPRLEFALNLTAIFTSARGRVLRTLSADGITVDVRRNPQATAPSQRFAWHILEDLVADNFKFSGVALHVENQNTIVDLKQGTLSGSQMATGVFTVDAITISSPWFQKSFSQLRGATSWQESRLTVGAISLMRGLDLDAITIDLSQIGQSRIGLEMNIDAFGGKIRASISSDDQGERRTWDAAGSVSEISLAQMSDALEWTNRASGSLHATKFTFRGEATDLRNATAAVWAEVTGLTWRDRTADTIMVGASLHNREVQIEQLYVKQQDNQFTLSGEFGLPQQWTDLLNPDFRGDVSASINDLGDFARLFGQSPSAFAGKVAINGSINARERKLGGALAVSGDSLVLFGAPVESLKAKLSFKQPRLEIEQFDLTRKADSFRGQAMIDLTGERLYSGNFTSSVANVAEYAALVPEAFAGFDGRLDLDWTGNGSSSAHFGTFRVRGHDLHPQQSSLIPFDAEIEGDYGPGNIFFRQFHLSNPRAELNAFVTIAKDYFQLQTLGLALNGKPKLQGNVFIPLSISKILAQNNWLAAWSDDPNFDVDVTLEPTDLAELAGAMTSKAGTSGQVAGRIELYGTPASLAGRWAFQLRDFTWDNQPRLSADLEARLALGSLSVKANATPSGSDLVRLEGTTPLQLEKRESSYSFKTDGPLSATLSFPAIFLAKLPNYLSRKIFYDGILSGQLSLSDSLGHPRVLGDLQLIAGKFGVGVSLSTRMTFNGQIGTIDFVQLKQGGGQLFGAGEIYFRDLSDMAVKLLPSMPLLDSGSLETGDCVAGVEFSGVPVRAAPFRPVRQIDFRGSLFSPAWTISLSAERGNDPLETPISSPRMFLFCSEAGSKGKTLTLRAAPDSFPR
ncbi:MAG: hypothetical protein QOG51_1227 [Verrucomicrobiota bacterium]|jgi:hypothetical protein